MLLCAAMDALTCFCSGVRAGLGRGGVPFVKFCLSLSSGDAGAGDAGGAGGVFFLYGLSRFLFLGSGGAGGAGGGAARLANSFCRLRAWSTSNLPPAERSSNLSSLSKFLN